MFRGRKCSSRTGITFTGKMSDSLKEIATVEKQPIKEGARLHVILAQQSA